MSLQTVRRLLRVALPTLALTLVEATVGAQSPALKTVLAVHWGSESYPANPVMDAAIREGLLPGFDAAIDYRAEYLESGDLPEKDASLALRDYIRRKYQRRRTTWSLRQTTSRWSSRSGSAVSCFPTRQSSTAGLPRLMLPSATPDPASPAYWLAPD